MHTSSSSLPLNITVSGSSSGLNIAKCLQSLNCACIALHMNGIISLKKKAEHGLAPVRVLAVLQRHVLFWPVPVAVRSKAWVCAHSPAEIVSSNTTGGMDVCFL